jgi:hypothetical protein
MTGRNTSFKKLTGGFLGLCLAPGLGGCAHLFYVDRAPNAPKTLPFISLGSIKRTYGRGPLPKTEFFLFDLTPLGLLGPAFDYPPIDSQTADGTMQINIMDENWTIPSRAVTEKFHIVFDHNLFGETDVSVVLSPPRTSSRTETVYMDTEPHELNVHIRCVGSMCAAKSVPPLSSNGDIRVKYVRRVAKTGLAVSLRTIRSG